jgi:ATP-dependent DNA helicase RecG
MDPVRAALRLAPGEVGRALLSLREDQWFDRKSARTAPADLAPIISGLANAEGGIVVLGLHGDIVEGVAAAGDENGWRQANLEFVEPPASVSVSMIACLTSSGRADQLMVLEVAASERLHRTHRDEVYLRVGDETRRLDFEQRTELAFDRGSSSFESNLTTLDTVDDLDIELVARWVPVGDRSEALRVLTARGLVRGSRLTVGGALLFSRAVAAELPEAHLRVIRYRGTERTSGSRQNVTFDQRFEGPLSNQIDDAADAITALAPVRQALGVDGRFDEIPAIPRDAWFEGIVNAVTHRSYSLGGDHTRIEILDDRIEVRSPGRFPGVVDLGDPTAVSRYARNPRVARVLADLRYGQERGEGIVRIFEEMDRAGLARPIYRQHERHVVLTLSARPRDEPRSSRLAHITDAVVRHLEQHRSASTGDLIVAVGLSRPTLLRHLAELREAGVIRWAGRSPQDPRATWQLGAERPDDATPASGR